MSGLKHQGKPLHSGEWLGSMLSWEGVMKHSVIYVENRDVQHLTELLSSCVTYLNNLQHLKWELYWNHKFQWFILLLFN